MFVYKKIWFLVIPVVLLGFVLAMAACQGPAGPPGPPGAAGAPGPQGPEVAAVEATGTIMGTVTSSIKNSPVAGLKIAIEPAVKDVILETDNNGKYSAVLPVGAYILSFKKDNYTAVTQQVSVAAGLTTTRDAVLKASKPVVVNAGKDVETEPGKTVNLVATVEILDGSQVSSYQWTQVAGVPATINSAESSAVTVVLSDAAAYKAKLIKDLKPHDRLDVLAINPHALTDAERATFRVTVTTSSGNYTGNVNVIAKLPHVITTGIRNVPVDVPVLLNGKKQNSYNWVMETPSGSSASLEGVTEKNPSFKPDVSGKYTITEENSKGKIEVFAGAWEGAITGQDGRGRPLSENCTACHDGKAAPDKFTEWKESGHAEIFTQNIEDPNGHWAINCAQCHAVEYNPKAKNNNFAEAVAVEGWKVPPHGDKGLWTQILEKFPKTAKLANIQCENCHGPNNGSTLHPNGKIDAERVSLSSEVCGSCHGEPPRHGRFQQWENSGHGNFEMAIEESTVEKRGATAAHCGRCHSAQGFLKWIKQGDLTKQIQGAKGNATVTEMTAMGMTRDKVQPQTCAVCHNPHAEGRTTGEPNNASVRIMEDSALLPAGFQAKALGRGTLCITCHNSRNALHNNDFPPNSYSAPHTASQGDVLMGENAYFVAVGFRSPHSMIKDSCAKCHMEATPPPAEFSYRQSGTNHNFKAKIDICGSCHAASLDGKALQAGAEGKIVELEHKMSEYMLKKIPAQVRIQDYTPHTFQGKTYDIKSDYLTIEKTNIASVTPTEPHGQQGFIIKFKNPVEVTYKPAKEAAHAISVREVEVQLGDITTDGKAPLIPTSDPLVKAGWNFFLIEGDGSKGVHNPSFVMEVLKATLSALK